MPHKPMSESSHRPRIAIVGTGNVASHLAQVISRCAYVKLTLICNRTIEHAQALATEIGNIAWGDLSELAKHELDIIIVSIADAAIPELATKIGRLPNSPLCLLTSGTIEMEALTPMSKRVGVLYPFQTFTQGINVDFSKISIFTEASDDRSLGEIDALAQALGCNVHHANAARRQILHIAGVYSNNFVNIILERAEYILASAELPFEVIEPLVRATVDKAFEIGPSAAQTGPARRGDYEVIKEQRSRLPEQERPLYELLTKTIIEKFHSENE